ncbi:DUF6053 domain-containing protein [Lysobacter gummosus]
MTAVGNKSIGAEAPPTKKQPRPIGQARRSSTPSFLSALG